MSLEYHQSELAIALDPSNPAGAMPQVLPTKHKRILDVGCGMGQTLLAAQLPSDVEAYGVDCEIETIEAGRRLAPPNVKLVWARGEHLPFEDDYFDLVFSRVALPYMHIGKALREISRVLKDGGDLWLMLHPASMVFSRAKRSARAGDLKDIVYCGYVLLNGVLFNCFGIQISFLGRQETFQTVGGITRAMKRTGLTCVPLQPSTHFILQGQKPSGRTVTTLRPRGERVPAIPVPKGRRSERVVSKRRASLVINLDRKPERLHCLILDSSKEGFRLRGSFDLWRGQVVELMLDEETPSPERCSVVWVGKAGSKQEGEVGLEAI